MVSGLQRLHILGFNKQLLRSLWESVGHLFTEPSLKSAPNLHDSKKSMTMAIWPVLRPFTRVPQVFAIHCEVL